MRCILFLAAATLTASVPQSVTLERRGPYLIAHSVYLNGAGPFRFLVDTGAESSVISNRLAARLGIKPESRTRQVTVAGDKLVGVGPLVRVELSTSSGSTISRSRIEVLIEGLERVNEVDPRADGILGHNFFVGRNFAIEYSARRLVFDPVPQEVRGERVPFRIHFGRIIVDASVGGRAHALVLDSGAPLLILFDWAPASRGQAARLGTNSGEVDVAMAAARVRIGSVSRRLPAVGVTRPGLAASVDGVLPASAFRSVYVNGESEYVVFEP